MVLYTDLTLAIHRSYSQVPSALNPVCVWSMVLPAMRVVWRCVLEVGGAQCVMMAGMSLMQAWSADSWDSLLQVRNCAL